MLSFYGSHPSVQIAFAVNLIRYQQGYLVDDIHERHSVSQCQTVIELPWLRDNIQGLESRLKIQITPEAVMQLLVHIMSSQACYDTEYMWLLLNEHSDQREQMIDFAYQVKHLMKRYHLAEVNLMSMERFMLTAYNVIDANLHQPEGRACNILRHEQECLAVGQELANIEPKFLANLTQLIEEFQEHTLNRVDANVTRQIIWYYCNLFPEVLRHFALQADKLQLAIYVTNQIQAKRWAYTIELIFRDLIELRWIDSPVEIFNLNPDNTDILLTAYPVADLNGVNTRFLQGFPTREDIEWLYSIVAEWSLQVS